MLARNRWVAIALVLVFACMAPASFATSADEVMKLTVGDVQSLAVENSKDLKDLDSNIIKLEDQLKRTIQASYSAQYNLEMIYDVRYLYGLEEDGIPMTAFERMELQIYKKIYGDTPPELTKESKYYNFKYWTDVVVPQMETQLEQLKNTRESVQYQIEKGATELYSQLLGLYGIRTVSEEFYNVTDKNVQDASHLYEVGMISKNDYEDMAASLDNQKSELEKLNSQIDNLEMMLKKMCEIPMDQEILLTDPTVTERFDLGLDLEEAMVSAEEHYTDLLNAELDLTFKQFERTYMDKYLSDSNLARAKDDFRQSDIDLHQAEYNIDKAQYDIADNVYSAHMDLLYQERNMEYLDSMVQEKALAYQNAELYFEQGLMKSADFIAVQTDYLNAMINYEKAENDYEYAKYKFQLLADHGILY